jgi:hypothetical protein
MIFHDKHPMDAFGNAVAAGKKGFGMITGLTTVP